LTYPDHKELDAQAASFFQGGHMQDTIASCQKILARDPENFAATHLVGKAAKQLGQHMLAESFFRAAIVIKPNSAEALSDLGLALMSQGKLDESLSYHLQALGHATDSPETHFNISTVLFDLGRMQESLQHCRATLSLLPASVPALVRMGMIHYKLDELHQAQASLDSAFLLAPDDISVLSLRTLIKINIGLPDEALTDVARILFQHPEDPFAISMRNAIARTQDCSSPKDALYNAGLIDLAESLARDELTAVDSVQNHNFLLKCYLVNSKHSALDFLQECREWSKEHAHEELLPQPKEFKNNRNPERRLRLGIVGDYFAGVIGAYTLLPFFKLYDRDKLEVYCYNFGPGGEYIQPVVDHYRDISQLSGEDFFKLVRHDVIDIMLDINGRMRTPNYFEALLRQPAPIQINWYNLPCTIGVKAFNYVITDDYCVRDGEENLFVEKVIRMPIGTICAWDMGDPPIVPPPPVTRNGYVTFGCFGDFFKVNENVLNVWANLLERVPDSHLYLKSNNLRLSAERERVSGFFRQRGIAAERLRLEGYSNYNQMKKCYEQVDIALDTFPYSSGSTTINALWQGVPVVAIDGNDWRGRSTAAVLAGCGLERFVANDVAGYIDLACMLAADSPQLHDLRANLGMCFSFSPQSRVGEFARHFEERLRTIWHDWLKNLH
jgi:predicted O-linked N-acetylglucosamine transferase (SPINDLY family)